MPVKNILSAIEKYNASSYRAYSLSGILCICVCLSSLLLFTSMRRLTMIVSALVLLPITLLLMQVVVGLLKRKAFEHAVIVLVFSIGLAVSIIPSINNLINSLEPMVKNPLATYDQKMSMLWGEHYDFLAFLRDNVSVNATIVLPPEKIYYQRFNFWPPFEEYFLYPRPVLQGDSSTSCEDYIPSSNPVVMVVVKDVWPVKYSADDVIMYDAGLGFLPCKTGVMP